MSTPGRTEDNRLHQHVRDGGALFHWVSGVALAGMSQETYQRVLSIQFQHDLSASAQRRQDQQVSECLSHEMFHAVQVSLCGYPLRIACLLSGMVADIVRAANTADFKSVVTKQFATAIKELIEPLGATINGISVAAIMESGALLAQKRFHKADLVSEEFRGFLV